MKTIESIEFDVCLNIASNLKMFEKIVREGFRFRYLVTLLANEPENLQLVLNRMLELSSQPIDLQYEHPADTALTVYLLALESVDLEVAKRASFSVLQAKNCWWSAKLADGLNTKNLSDREFESTSSKERS